MSNKIHDASTTNPYHPYLCWLDQIKGISRKTKLLLLYAAAAPNLFSEGGIEDENREPFGKAGPGERCQDLSSGGGMEEGRRASFYEAGSKERYDKAAETAGEEPIHLAVPEGDGAAIPAEPALELAEAARLLFTAPEDQLRFLCAEALPAGSKGGKTAQLLMAARKREPERVLDELSRAQISFSCIVEEDFPSRLRTIPDPPFGIYCRGRLPEEAEPAAGVIGARLASGYGREQARRFAWRLGKEGIAVISGMARGIDGIAQTAALDAGGSSYAVLGCGVDICYPKENRELYDRLISEGGILSEYPPGTPPESKLFPPRNRIISGLSDLVLVIEARRRSGTLITVDMALEQGREVYALPGRVSDSLSDGCNRLIRQGAGAATCPEDILEYFFGASDAEEEKTGPREGKEKEAEKEKTGLLEGKKYAEEEKTGLCEEKMKYAEEEKHSPHKEKKKPEDGARAAEGKSFRERKRPRTPVEEAVLKTLSTEDEIHLDRILEGVNRILAKTGGDPVQITTLVPVLMKLQSRREVREETPGYYVAVRKTKRD